jgi:hypothetical protein
MGDDGDNEVEDAHPIGSAIDRFIHRVRDTKLAARVHIPLAGEVNKRQAREIGVALDRISPLIGSTDARTAALAQKEAAEVMLRLRRLKNSDVPGAIEVGLFLTLFASYDAFTGDLLRALYRCKPDLFNGLSRSVPFSDILVATSIDQVKESVLEEDIESLRRKSYAEQFAILESRFGLNLTRFTKWPDFVECSQRRNLLTHCDGIVSAQYLKVCREVGVSVDALPVEGSQVALGASYFYQTCELMIEVGLKLGQTLWRKTLPEELRQAEEHLRDTIFETLEQRIWKRARMMGEFAMGQKNWATDRNRRTILVNYVQALKRDGAVKEAQKVLASVDWTAASPEFQLADQVLRENYDAAAETMIAIGSRHPMLQEHAYHIWPLFLEFRETKQFADAYARVFGHTYSAKLGAEVAEAQRDAVQESMPQQDSESSDSIPSVGPSSDDADS